MCMCVCRCVLNLLVLIMMNVQSQPGEDSSNIGRIAAREREEEAECRVGAETTADLLRCNQSCEVQTCWYSTFLFSKVVLILYF